MNPNVLLICVDQWRGDCLSCVGHPVVKTPYLDHLAAKGCRFTQAYSECPSCIAARASLFTGLSPEHTGRVGYNDGVEWNYGRTLASEFTRHGYQTQAVGKMHVYPERSQLGFQNVILHDGYLHFARREHCGGFDMIDDYLPWLRARLGRDADYFEHGHNSNAYTTQPWDKPEYTHPTNFVTSQSIDFLRRRDPRKPFFLFMSYHRPHPPLDPPAWALEQYLNADMPEVPVGEWADIWQDYYETGNPALQAGIMNHESLTRARAGYYALITHIDAQINRFLETLDEFSLAEDTCVCFVSDHGDMLGDHHLFRKTLPYDGSCRIPFILSGRGIRANTLRHEVTGLQDVMPTLLDLAGLPVPDSLDGRSVLPLLDDKSRNVKWRKYLHCEHVFKGLSIQWLTDGKMKYIWRSDGIEQLFDLHKDPHELKDISTHPDFKNELAMWRDRLIDELRDREEGFVVDGKLSRSCRPVTDLQSV